MKIFAVIFLIICSTGLTAESFNNNYIDIQYIHINTGEGIKSNTIVIGGSGELSDLIIIGGSIETLTNVSGLPSGLEIDGMSINLTGAIFREINSNIDLQFGTVISRSSFTIDIDEYLISEKITDTNIGLFVEAIIFDLNSSELHLGVTAIDSAIHVKAQVYLFFTDEFAIGLGLGIDDEGDSGLSLGLKFNL